MQKNTLIERLDSFLTSKKPSEALLISLVVAAVAGYTTFLAISDPAEKFSKDYATKHTAKNAQLTTANADIERYKSLIPNLQKEITASKATLERTQYTNGYVDTKLKELSYLLFNDKSWASFMDRITFLAKKHNITVIKISNNFLDEKKQAREKVEQVLTVNVGFSSEFKNLIKFINEIEESQLVVDVNKIDLLSTRKIDGNISISVWGMLY
jgi:DNA repair exonuclease SbcCD ATPase subunit